MTHMVPTLGRRALALAGALALGLTSLVATTASADPSDIDFGNINFDAAGSVIVNKHEHQGAGAVNGSPDGSTAPTSPGIGNVEFTVWLLDDIDLRDPVAWNGLKDLAPGVCAKPAGASIPGYVNAAGDPGALRLVDTLRTGANGQVTFPDLAVGAYLVCETDAPSNVVDKALPFIVTVPTPFDNGWVYDVNVYPKNGLQAGISKVNLPQTQLTIGSEAAFQVTTDVPTLANATHWEYFRIVDPIDSNLKDADVRNVKLGTDDLVKDVDYKVIKVGQGAGNTGGQVIIQFTVAGMKKLEAAAPAKVTADFYGTVNTIPTDGVIKNIAFVDSKTYVDPDPTDPEEPGEPADPTDPVDPPTDPETPVTPPVYTNWGDLKGLKFTKNDKGTEVNLEGAEFAIFPATTAYPADGVCTAAYDTTGTAVDTATSTNAGLIQFQGLHVSQGTSTDPGSAFRCYVLVETKAPAGYTLNATPIPAKVVKGLTDVQVAYDLKVENVQQKVPGLPLTGGVGQVALGLGGGGLLVITLLVMAGRRARRCSLPPPVERTRPPRALAMPAGGDPAGSRSSSPWPRSRA